MKRQTNQTGIFKMTDEDYFASDGVSNSSLNNMSKSPTHYRHNLDNPMESTPAMVFGSLVHTICLEPFEVEERYAVIPSCDKRTKEGKALMAEFKENNKGKIAVSKDHMDKAQAMFQSINNNTLACDLMGRSGDNEMAVFSEDKDTGLMLRGKIDRICEESNCIVDLKTTSDASNSGFQQSVFRYNYHRQASMYIDLCTSQGLKIDAMIFVTVEKEAPYAVNVFELDDYTLEKGRRAYKNDLQTLAGCEFSNTWPSYSDELQIIETPRYLQI